AEDVIRQRNVTGVKTCALPISSQPRDTDALNNKLYVAVRAAAGPCYAWLGAITPPRGHAARTAALRGSMSAAVTLGESVRGFVRSEERRVGKSEGLGERR